jgi:hypothetical protein
LEVLLCLEVAADTVEATVVIMARRRVVTMEAEVVEVAADR